MFDLRSPLVLGAAPAGLALGALAWLAIGRSGPAPARFDALEAAASPTSHKLATSGLKPDPVAQAVAFPLFALTTGNSAVRDAVLRLDGIALTPGHAAALLSIDGKTAGWLQAGESRDGVRLVDVQPQKVVLDTVTGFKEVVLAAEPAAQDNGQQSSGAKVEPPPANASGTDPGRK